MEACEEREEMSIDDVEAAIACLSDAIKQAEAVGVDAELVPWAYCGRSVAMSQPMYEFEKWNV